MDEAASRIRDRQSGTIERKRPLVEAALLYVPEVFQKLDVAVSLVG
jgi:hypothetical protein